MVRIVKGIVLSCLCLVSVAMCKHLSGHAAVGLNREKDGQVTYYVFGSGDTGKLEDLAASLKKSGYRDVDISAWSSQIDYRSMLKSLAAADLRVTSCYVPMKGKAAWFRENLSSYKLKRRRRPQLDFVKRLIEDNKYNRRYKLPDTFKRVTTVTIHNTAEPFTALQERDRVDTRRDKQSVSFHFAVDESMVVQILPLDIHGWHAADGHGKGNLESIAIEICRSQCRGRDSYLYERSEENAKLLACALLRHYNLSPKDLRMHKDWCGKFCPHRILERGEKGFEDFRRDVGKLLRTAPTAEERVILKALKRQ